MKYVPLPASGKKKTVQIDTFGGLLKKPDAALGQWREAINMSSQEYPRLTVRPMSKTVSTLDKNPTGDCLCLCGGDELAVVFRTDSGKGKIYAGGFGLTVYANAQSIPVTNRRKIVRMGAWAVMFPDGFYVNAVKLANLPSGSDPETAMTSGTDYGWIDAEFLVEEPSSGTAPTVTLALVDDTGHEYYDIAAEEPEEPSNGDAYIDTEGDSPRLLQYFDGNWSILPTFTRIYIDGLAGFENKDWVTMRANIHETTLYGTDSEETVNALLNSSHEVHGNGLSGLHGDWIEIEGAFYIACPSELAVLTFSLENTQGTPTKEYIKIERKAPAMDYVVECGNRLWGCYYGTGEDGEILNELYACALGDFKQWRKYNGLSTASWTASRGSEGPWTGAEVLDGHPLFFKTGCVEKIYPSSTGAHQVVTQNLDGVEDGAWRTLAVIDNVLYYKAKHGVVSYTGTLPQLISEALGSKPYSALIGARHEELYVILMKQSSSEAWKWYVYDTKRGIWHCCTDDSEGAGYAVTFQRKLYFIGDSPSLWSFDGGSGAGVRGNGVKWSCETGAIGYRGNGAEARKYITRLFVRLKVGLGAAAALAISYDDGAWITVESIDGSMMAPRILMITPRRCDSFRLRLSGQGACEVQAIAYDVRTGGRLH